MRQNSKLKLHSDADATHPCPATPPHLRSLPATTPRRLPHTTAHRFTPHVTPLKMPPVRPLPPALRGGAAGERMRQLAVAPVRILDRVGVLGVGSGVTVRRERCRERGKPVEKQKHGDGVAVEGGCGMRVEATELGEGTRLPVKHRSVHGGGMSG